MIKKIWTDPVWSKVISVAIIALGTTVYSAFESATKGINFWITFKGIIFYGVPLIYILIVLIAYWIVRRVLKNVRDGYTKKEKALRSFNFINNPKEGYLYKWQVYFEFDKPFVGDLEFFCTRHGKVPIRLIDNMCSDYDC